MKKEIYLVGGAIRDKLLGRPNHDKDYVAIGYSQKDFRHLEQVGKSFPVFLLPDGSQIALARKETKIAQGYHGFKYDTANITLEEDLKRRDLTINSMAYHEQQNKLIDPFNGKQDLEKKILRHTSLAFSEDPLRVLRIARFRAKLGRDWKIHPSTKVLIYAMRKELKHLEKNRIYQEVEQILCYKNSHLFFETLFELGVLKHIFPSLYKLTTLKEGNLYHLESSVFAHTMSVLEHLSNQNPTLKLAALYHDIAKPYCYRNFGNGNKHDNPKIIERFIDIQIPKKISKEMLILCANHMKISLFSIMKPKKRLKLLESYKKNKNLLLMQLSLFDADQKGKISAHAHKPLNKEAILQAFDAIAHYSPRAWLQSLNYQPNGNQIKEHVHQAKIAIIKTLSV